MWIRSHTGGVNRITQLWLDRKFVCEKDDLIRFVSIANNPMNESDGALSEFLHHAVTHSDTCEKNTTRKRVFPSFIHSCDFSCL